MTLKRELFVDQTNCSIIESVITRYKDSSDIYSQVDQFTLSLQNEGVNFQVYENYVAVSKRATTRQVFTLWEGGHQYPFVIELFVWPSKVFVESISKDSKGYCTPIHAHPIPCAFTVVSNDVSERIYEKDTSGQLNYQTTIRHQKGYGTVDVKLNHDFIHQLLYEGSVGGPCYAQSLHIYGVPYSKDISSVYNSEFFFELV
tara:strand:- start:1158 stop:1760 length:603 start_codon:yes stop_codon:yes gene_type:complete